MNRAWTWLDLLSGMTWTTLPVVGLMHIPFLAKGILGIRKQEIMKFSILSTRWLTI
jgi:hypothetical protein